MLRKLARKAKVPKQVEDAAKVKAGHELAMKLLDRILDEARNESAYASMQRAAAGDMKLRPWKYMMRKA
jgi:hypothetical protein